MAIQNVAAAAQVGAAASSPQSTKESFAQVAQKVAAPPKEPGAAAPQSHAAPTRATAGVACAEGTGTVSGAPPVTRAEAARVAERVLQAQQKLEKVLELAQSGKTFTSAELIALQAHVYGASQEIDLAGKVVEKATTGLKTLLQTQL